MFTKATIISALAGLAAAAPTARATDTNVFQIVALHSTSPIQGAGINANGYSFFTGKPTSADCPSYIEGLDCSSCKSSHTLSPNIHSLFLTQFTVGNQTLLDFNPAGPSASLYASVPGGQQIFVRADGSLGYTTPHSASIPEGAALAPFQCTSLPFNPSFLQYNKHNLTSTDTPQAQAGSVGVLTFKDIGFNACPVSENVYQIFARAVSAETQVGCIDITMGTAEVDEKNASYQY